MKTKTPRYKLTNLERRYFPSPLALRYIECTLLNCIYLFLPLPPYPTPVSFPCAGPVQAHKYTVDTTKPRDLKMFGKIFSHVFFNRTALLER